ncbi:hypothetical protein NECID01_0783 [Nematocida sp. AWRm77]|nr:hypothetical protein NECID01_0783 [Nematocida sp. AWRm77]
MRIAELLNRAQTEQIKERREVLEELKDAVLHGSMPDVFREFCECITVVMGSKRGEVPKSITQLVTELMKALKHLKDGRNFIHNTIKYLVRGVDAKLKHVRINSLLMLRGCIEHLDAVSPKLWGIVKVKVGEKLFDKEASVRIHAVHIVARYQEECLDTNLPFYKLLKDLLRYDASPEIRKAVLASIVTNKSTLSAIITRAGDVSESVRAVFVGTKLGSVLWEELTLQQRHGLLHLLEGERVGEIRRKFLQKFEAVFEEVFQGRYEHLVEAFYAENQDNAALERVLRELMKKYEYADGFTQEFLAEATPARLFLMRASLEHVDSERGRDTLALPELPVLLKSIIDSSVGLESTDVFAGSLSCTLFSLLEYYDVFQNEERALLVKCGLFILGRESALPRGVVEQGCKMLLKANAGVDSGKVFEKALSAGSKRGQALFGECLLKQHRRIGAELPGVFGRVEEAARAGVSSEIEDVRRASIRTLALAAQHHGTSAKVFETLADLARSGEEEAVCALADCAIMFGGERYVFEWVYQSMERGEIAVPDRAAVRLLLSDLPGEEEAEKMLSSIVQRFYSEKGSPEETQYLHVFLHEYFRRKHWMVFSVYHRVISTLKHWKVFNDQILYWFSHREDRAYEESAFLLLALSATIKAFRETEEKALPKDRKDVLLRHLDLLGKVSALEYSLGSADKQKALDMATALSRNIVKIVPENDVVKNLLFDLVSKE